MKERCLKDIMETDGVHKVTGPMCRWDVVSRLAPRGYVLWRAMWMTNSPALARLLEEVSCSAEGGQPWRRQVESTGGLAGVAHGCPPVLMKMILRSLKEQMVENGDLSTLDAYAAGPVAEEPVMTEEVLEEFWDRSTAATLSPGRSGMRGRKSWHGSSLRTCSSQYRGMRRRRSPYR